MRPVDVGKWIGEHHRPLVDRWVAEVTSGESKWSGEVEDLLREFLDQLVSIIPPCLGPYRPHLKPLWRQACELYGSTAAMRGLAAGEVLEEFQFLRDGLIRLLYSDPPPSDGGRLSMRDALRVNRLIDLGVTGASVGHTDALFFALFQGSGLPETLTAELRDEIRSQLEGIQAEIRSVLSLQED